MYIMLHHYNVKTLWKIIKIHNCTIQAHTFQPSKIRSSYLQKTAKPYSFSCATSDIASCLYTSTSILTNNKRKQESGIHNKCGFPNIKSIGLWELNSEKPLILIFDLFLNPVWWKNDVVSAHWWQSPKLDQTSVNL